jgi:hypothetical protein
VKIAVIMDDDTQIIYQNVTDAFLVARVDEPLLTPDAQYSARTFTKSNSWGSNPRELVKEAAQAVLELQDYLREHRHGNSSPS